MKALRILSSVFWILLMMIACNTSTENPDQTEEDAVEKADVNSEAETSTEDDNSAAANSLEGEEFPGNGFKGRQEDYVIYIETTDGISGFVRHKDSGEEYEISGDMSSPFAFEAEEVGEDEDGDEMTMAKIRGQMSNDGNSIKIDYNDANSAITFRLELKR